MQSWTTRQAPPFGVASRPQYTAAAACRVLRLTVDSAAVTSLRQLAMRVCGDALEFMRIAVCAGGRRVQVWLCVRQGQLAELTEAVLRQLPGARLYSHRDVQGALQ